MNTYSKLRDGTWGVRVTGQRPSGPVSVARRDGTTKTELIDRVLWSSPDGQTHLCSIRSIRGRSGRSGSYRSDRAPSGRSCPTCGSRECARAWNPRDLCDED